jgi:hypothetical protein
MTRTRPQFQPLIQQVVNDFRPQLVRDNQTGVARIVPLTTASGATAIFDETRIEPGISGAPPIEVKIAAPELLDTGCRLPRFEMY